MGKKKDMEAKIAAAVAAAMGATAEATGKVVEVKETSSESLSVSGKSGTC